MTLRGLFGNGKSEPGMVDNFLPSCGVMQTKLYVGSRRHQLPRTERTIILKLRSRHIAKLERHVCAGCRDWPSALWKFTSTGIAHLVGPRRNVVHDVGCMWNESNADVMRYGTVTRQKLHGRDPRVFRKTARHHDIGPLHNP